MLDCHIRYIVALKLRFEEVKLAGSALVGASFTSYEVGPSFYFVGVESNDRSLVNTHGFG